MTDTSGYMELIHECNVCRGRFSDEELLRTHICPMAQEGTIELNAEAGVRTATTLISAPLLRELLELPEDIEIVPDDDIGNIRLTLRSSRIPEGATEVTPVWRKLGESKTEFLELKAH